MSRQTKIDWHKAKVQLLTNELAINTRLILPMENSVSSSLSSSTTTVTSSPSYPAASLANLFLDEINYQDVHGLLDVQRSLLEQVDNANEKLDSINKFSAKRFIDAQRDFASHTHVLNTMKSDLDLIFKRIKLLKQRLSKKYPTAYSSVLQTTSTPNDLLDDDEEDAIDSVASKKSVTSPSIVDNQMKN